MRVAQRATRVISTSASVPTCGEWVFEKTMCSAISLRRRVKGSTMIALARLVDGAGAVQTALGAAAARHRPPRVPLLPCVRERGAAVARRAPRTGEACCDDFEVVDDVALGDPAAYAGTADASRRRCRIRPPSCMTTGE